MARRASLPSSVSRSVPQGGDQTQLMPTSSMPSRPTSAALVAPSIMSVSGQAAEVRVMSRTTLRPSSSCSTPYSSPRSTTFTPSSGSSTCFMASKICASLAIVGSSLLLSGAAASSPRTALAQEQPGPPLRCMSPGPRSVPFAGKALSLGGPGRVLVLTVDRLAPVLTGQGPGGGVPERHPAEQGALDPHGVPGHAREGDPVLQQLLVGLALAVHQPAERVGRLQRVGHLPVEHEVAHDRGGGKRDRAALAVDRDPGHPVAVQPQAERELVPAHRVVVAHLHVASLEPPRMPGLLVV